MTGQKPKVLVIDDMTANIKILHSLLRDQYSVSFATTGQKGLALALSEGPDLALLDISMPDMDGYEVCRRLKASLSTASIPVIFITSLSEEKDEAKGLALGAIDYITKPFSPAIVQARVRNHIELAQARKRLAEAHAQLAAKNEELDKKNRALEVLSRTDLLTGLSNRRRLEETLQAELLRARRYGAPFSVVLLDVDRFKTINDRFGHQTGDAVLVRLAEILTREVRETDVAGRWGGEEFLVVCPECDLDCAAILARRLRERVAAHGFLEAGQVTISLGVAAILPEDDVQQVVSRADEALYRAKQNGRDRVELQTGRIRAVAGAGPAGEESATGSSEAACRA